MSDRLVTVLVNGTWRTIPRDWWDSLIGPKPPHGFENDGCTIVRDRIRGRAAWPACVIHDWHWSPECPEVHGDDAPGFTKSNWIFGRNTYKVLRLQGKNVFSALFFATVRAAAVQQAYPLFRRPR